MTLLVGSDEAYNILPARGTSCILSRLCPIFNLVCSTFLLFCSPSCSFTLLGITFYKATFTVIFLIWSCTSGCWDLKRHRKYYQLQVHLAYSIDFAQFCITVCSEFCFLAFHLVSHYIKMTFS